MNWRRIVFGIALVAAIAYTGLQMWPRQPTVASLERQLAGSHCSFVFEIDRCERGFFDPLRYLLTTRHDCDLWAVKCLGQHRTPEATKVLVGVLQSKTDIETCDGGLPIRSLAVRYLGESGDRSAGEPLKRHLRSNPMSRLSSGASGCQAFPEGSAEIEKALAKLGN